MPSSFRFLLIVVIAIFATSVAALVAVACWWSQPTALQTQVVDVLDAIAKSTLGAVLGLLGGKAAS